jgi:hypothetical protein
MKIKIRDRSPSSGQLEFIQKWTKDHAMGTYVGKITRKRVFVIYDLRIVYKSVHFILFILFNGIHIIVALCRL